MSAAGTRMSRIESVFKRKWRAMLKARAEKTLDDATQGALKEWDCWCQKRGIQEVWLDDRDDIRDDVTELMKALWSDQPMFLVNHPIGCDFSWLIVPRNFSLRGL